MIQLGTIMSVRQRDKRLGGEGEALTRGGIYLHLKKVQSDEKERVHADFLHHENSQQHGPEEEKPPSLQNVESYGSATKKERKNGKVRMKCEQLSSFLKTPAMNLNSDFLHYNVVLEED